MRFHMLPEDCRSFVHFLQQRDPVIVAEIHSSESESAEISEVFRPWDSRGFYCLWNQAIPPELTRKAFGKFFHVDHLSVLVIEFTCPSPTPEPWNGQPALEQSRIWANFKTENQEFERWYNAVVRWIRKNFIRDVGVGFGRDSIGPAAYDWFKAGGLLLPSFRPPVRDNWLAWVSAQSQHRANPSVR
jgi:hypothetical protein